MNDVTPTTPQAANSGRYSLNDDGQIFFQPDATNPLPGNAVGKLVKGEALLLPTTDYEPARDWLAIHVRSVLEPLFALKQEAGEGTLPEGPARDIGAALYEHLGVMHRADLEDQIAKLDPDTRKSLRSKGVRLGPILVFLPALVKPAAVKMRAVLWGLWNDKTLPVAKPADGRVSEVVDPAAIDRHFYRMIGYPVFGPRAIRIDMLDRVITDIYDTADKGVFEAKHKYAEWLGTNLDDLYAVLESMGHRRAKDLPVAADVTTAEALVEAPALEAVPAAEVSAPVGIVAESAPVAEVIATAAKPQPVLVKFVLKRGKMSDRPQGKRPPREKKPKKTFDPNKPVMLTEDDKARIAERAAERQKQKESRPKSKDRDRDRGDVPRRPKDKRGDRTESNEGRIYTFESAKKDGDDDGNPFAILKNLKK